MALAVLPYQLHRSRGQARNTQRVGGVFAVRFHGSAGLVPGNVLAAVCQGDERAGDVRFFPVFRRGGRAAAAGAAAVLTSGQVTVCAGRLFMRGRG